MLKSFGILVMRRLMRQIDKTGRVLFSQVKGNKSIIKESQKRMAYEALFLCFYLSQKGAFLRLFEMAVCASYPMISQMHVVEERQLAFSYYCVTSVSFLQSAVWCINCADNSP
jgi:hypothetical protein